ncbi:MAG TPA: type II secretion system protein GspN [Nitrospira sp.]|nr:type II secretion system protein GspN [Nitrospira sp.]
MTMTWPGSWKAILIWTAVGLGTVVSGIAATFPYDALHARAMSELNRSTGMDVHATNWTSTWPLGLAWRNVTLTRPDWEPIQLGLLHAKIGLLPVLTGGLGLDVEARLDETASNTGLAKAALTASSWSLADGSVSLKGRLQQVDLSKILHRYVSRGVLNGEFTHRVDSFQATAGPLKGEGTWTADATDLAIDHIPLMNGRMLSLVFTKVSAGLACRDAVCEVTELNGDGLDGSFTGHGTITLQQPMQNSQLALTVTVTPGTGFAAKADVLGLPPFPAGTSFTIKIVGPLAQARIAL